MALTALNSVMINLNSVMISWGRLVQKLGPCDPGPGCVFLF